MTWLQVELETVALLRFISQTYSTTKRHITWLSHLNLANCFASPEGRYRFIKALLHPCSYIQECQRCRQHHKDICEHFLTSCTHTAKARTRLHLKLTLYNYPNIAQIKKVDILDNTLGNKVWRKCFTDFLTEIDF